MKDKSIRTLGAGSGGNPVVFLQLLATQHMLSRMTNVPFALMLQGVSSSAGKTLLTAALCRILTRLDLTVYPFKAQNMSSHAHILPDGLHMSCAQALQAVAARQTPRVEMNPVLLRPAGAAGSDVFLLGKEQGRMTYARYSACKEEFFQHIRDAYFSLARNAQVMLIEGAGSPAEINLLKHDIVNMRVAHMARAIVWLVGDIDRGGVFAHLYGTFALLAPQDRALLHGFILNKFRGDASLLHPAERFIEKKTGIPFLATVPFLPSLNLPEEDSMGAEEKKSSFKMGQVGKAGAVPLLSAAADQSLDFLADAVLKAFPPGFFEALSTRIARG